FNQCVTQSCWDSTIGAVAQQTPVMIGEIGQNTCAHDYIDRLMAWADGNGLGYAAWTWNAWGLCNSSGNDLILDNAGTPTSTFGEGFNPPSRDVDLRALVTGEPHKGFAAARDLDTGNAASLTTAGVAEPRGQVGVVRDVTDTNR